MRIERHDDPTAFFALSAPFVEAALTEQLLEHRPFCFLYTDLANPASNSIYQRIGYRALADITVWRLDAAGAS
jgi:hypothetical protein